jgi:mono/diheme cytochrome c family protein
MNKLTLLAMLGAVAASLIAATAFATGGWNTTDANALVERGRYLVNTSGCNDCHTPWKMGPHGPGPDLDRLLSGHPEGFQLGPVPKVDPDWPVRTTSTMTAWTGPWGVSFASNLTPDPETGLGRWTTEDFIRTIRNARHQGSGRPLLPPMPAEVYANMTDDDLRAIHAYLKSIPPMVNRVPAPLPPQ